MNKTPLISSPRLRTVFAGTAVPLLLLTLLLILSGVNSASSDPLSTLHHRDLPVSPDIELSLDPSRWMSQPQPLPLSEDATIFAQQAKLLAGDRVSYDFFGTSIAIEGDMALIGAPGDDIGANYQQGSVYVFTRSGTTWTQQLKITAGDGADSDWFGASIALDGNTALIGASQDDAASGYDQGSAYIFVRDGATWTQQAKMTLNSGMSGGMFGSAVALEGDTALVGITGGDYQTGAVYVFTRSGTTWAWQAVLTASDSVTSDWFGDSIALSGDTVLVGAPHADIDANYQQGAAYVFTRSGTVWSQQSKLTIGDGASGDWFGDSLALTGDTALIGVAGRDTGTDPDENQGAVYVFTRSSTTWSQQTTLLASNPAISDAFGSSVALDGNMALIGASGRDSGANQYQGAAYIFTGGDASWAQQQKFAASDGTAYEFFGRTVALSGEYALIGVENDSTDGWTKNGSAYVFASSNPIPTITPSFTPTEGSSPTITPTPTMTNTPLPGAELVENGGFEGTTLTPWVLKNGTSDKIKCNKPGKDIAHSGNCAFVFKGSIGESSALIQSPDASSLIPATGDTFDFSAYVKAGSMVSAKIKVVVKYSDASQPGKISITLLPTEGYQPVVDSLDLLPITISKIKVQIRHSSLSGKLFVDDVSLRYVSGSGSGLIGLP